MRGRVRAGGIHASLSAAMPDTRRFAFLPLAFACWAAAVCAPALAQENPITCDTISAIEVRGNAKMSADAVRFDLTIKPGARWDDGAVHREYIRFWRRGLFSDLRFSKRCDPAGAVLVIDLRERPTLLSVTYDKSKDITQQQIEDYFKQREFQLQVGQPLDRKKIWRAESLIKEALAQKGFMDAEAKAEIKTVSATTRSVVFHMKGGGKTRIRKLNFIGNEAFGARTLRSQLKLVEPWKWYWPWGAKSLYHPLKYQQDSTNITQYYKDHGYLDADLRPPAVDVRAVDPEKAKRKAEARAAKETAKQAKDKEKAVRAGATWIDKPAPEPDVRVKKWVYLTVPVDEGKLYHLGTVKFEGNTIFKPEELRRYIPLRDGAILSDAALEAGVTAVRAAYGAKGYVYAAVTRRFERRPGPDAVADVVVQIEEEQPYTIRRIEFRGNTTTNDVVLRREMNVFEGELLNKAQLDRSVQKLQMLGFWMPGEEPTLEPVPGKSEVNVRVQGEEQSRNEVQIGGGYSELEGAFFLASYQTRNLLGRGEALELSAQVGGYSNRSSISFTEPWFLGKPNTFGFQLFRRSYDYGQYQDASGAQQRLQQTSTGGALTLGRRLGDFSTFQITYGYESVDADTIDVSSYFASTRTKIGSLTPLYSFRRVNNPMRPTRGMEIQIVPQIASKIFGGDTNFFRPRISFSGYHPIFSKLFVAAHLEAQYVRAFGSYDRKTGVIDGVPRFERFYLGGDSIGPRIFETRSISPLRDIVEVDQNGNPVLDAFGNPYIVSNAYVGGNKSILGQFELGLPIGKTATFAGFFDAGGVYDNGVHINTSDMRMSAGVEFRVYLPVFQAPIRLIYGWPIKSKSYDEISRFQFSIGLPF